MSEEDEGFDDPERQTREARVTAAVDSMFGLEFDDMWYDTATHFSCAEAEAIAEVMRAAGQPGLAAGFINAHAQDDDEGDMHYSERTDIS